MVDQILSLGFMSNVETFSAGSELILISRKFAVAIGPKVIHWPLPIKYDTVR